MNKRMEPLVTLLNQPCDEGSVEPTTALALGSLLLRGMSKESLLFTIDFGLASVKVGFVRLDHLRFHDEFVTENANHIDRNALR